MPPIVFFFNNFHFMVKDFKSFQKFRFRHFSQKNLNHNSLSFLITLKTFCHFYIILNTHLYMVYLYELYELFSSIINNLSVLYRQQQCESQMLGIALLKLRASSGLDSGFSCKFNQKCLIRKFISQSPLVSSYMYAYVSHRYCRKTGCSYIFELSRRF